VLTVAALVPFFAQASHQNATDPNDVQGLLDVRRVHVSPERPPRYTFRTFRRWTVAEVWDAGYLLVHFDSFGNQHFDYYALVRSNGNELLGSLWRDRIRRSDYKVGNIKVWRTDRERVTVRVPLDRLNVRRAYYRWYASTLFTSDVCPHTCIDRIPDGGAIEEPLVEPTPTITVTPTPTITVTPTPTPKKTKSP
jgi:hypothetical protein